MAFYLIRQSAVIAGTLDPSLFWREEKICKAFSAITDSYIVTSSFDHYSKQQRANQADSIDKGFQVNYLYSPGYQSNKGVARIVDAWFFALGVFFFLARQVRRGDYVLFSMPTPEPLVLIRLMRLFGVKVVVDFRDKWPESLVSKGPLKKFFDLYIRLLFRIGDVRGARLTSMSDTLSNYYSRMLKIPEQKITSFICRRGKSAAGSAAVRYGDKPSRFIFFAGTLGDQFDYEMFHDFYSRICTRYPDTWMLIAGSGPRSSELRKLFVGYTQVIFLGRISSEDVREYMGSSTLNFCFYHGVGFRGHVTNKILEYCESERPFVHNLGRFFVAGRSYKLGLDVECDDIRTAFDDTPIEDDRKEFLESGDISRIVDTILGELNVK